MSTETEPLLAPSPQPTRPTTSIVLGLVAALGVAVIATIFGHVAPLIGAPVFAILIGALVANIRPLPAAFKPGVGYAAKKVLQGAIIVSGFGLSLATVAKTGLATLPVALATIAIALLLAPIIGRLLHLDGALRQLIGVGTAICGASAIAAVATVIEPPDEDIALSVATIFFYNIVAVLVFPPIGHLLHLSQAAFGTWAGTAVNDTSSVVAAGYAYGQTAGAHATIVKLARATLILPIVGAIAITRARARRSEGAAVPWVKIVPWFIVWFLVAALIDTVGLIPASLHGTIAFLSTFLISVALAAIGFQTNIGALVHAGVRPLALGFILWIAVAVTSLIVQHAIGA